MDPAARNDLGLLFLLSIDLATKKCVACVCRDECPATDLIHLHHVHIRPVRVEAIPLKLDFCLSRRLRSGSDYEFIVRRFKHQCAKLGTAVHETGDGRLYFDLP